jgi:phage replication-related protein YjqB (UPF0714/DUF867 family)
MHDKYPNFNALAAAEPADSYSILMRYTDSPIVVAAPHGGGIEPGTSEIARTIAGDVFSYYTFEGKKNDGNCELHITSSNFDEPQCLALLSTANTVVTIHGEASESEAVYLGGLSTSAQASVRVALEPHGFLVCEHSNPDLQGLHTSNICNMGRFSMGLQLELSFGLRKSFFFSLSRGGRKKPTERLFLFSALVRQALLRNMF